MKYVLLSQYEKQFHRTPFKAIEDMATMSADELRWFVWAFGVKSNPELKIQDVEGWTSKELTEAVNDFFGVVPPSIPS